MRAPKTSICFRALPLVYRKPLTIDKIDTSISGGISDIEYVVLGSRRIDGQVAKGRGAELGKRSINTSCWEVDE